MRSSALIPAFFLWNCLTIVSISLPGAPSTATGFANLLSFNASYIQPLIRPYAIGTGLMQYWNMFVHAPGAANDWFDIKYHLEFEFVDGSNETIDYPRVSEMSFWESLAGFRYRKFMDFAATNQHLYEPTMRSLALAKFPQKTPVRVKISQSWARIPSPADSGEMIYQRRFFKTIELVKSSGAQPPQSAASTPLQSGDVAP